jgi:hypothetical protein
MRPTTTKQSRSRSLGDKQSYPQKENGYATSWFGKEHNTPGFQYSIAGPFDQWPVGMGFEYFYGFMGDKTDQWKPYLLAVRNCDLLNSTA